MNAVMWATVTAAKKRPVFLVLDVVVFFGIYINFSSFINDALLFYLSMPITMLTAESVKTFVADPFRESLEMLYIAPKSVSIHSNFNVIRTLFCSVAYAIPLLISRIFCQNAVMIEDTVTGVSVAIFTVFVLVLTVAIVKKMPTLCMTSMSFLVTLQTMAAALVGYLGFYVFREYSLIIVSVALLFSVILAWFVIHRGCSIEKAIVRSILS